MPKNSLGLREVLVTFAGLVSQTIFVLLNIKTTRGEPYCKPKQTKPGNLRAVSLSERERAGPGLGLWAYQRHWFTYCTNVGGVLMYMGASARGRQSSMRFDMREKCPRRCLAAAASLFAVELLWSYAFLYCASSRSSIPRSTSGSLRRSYSAALRAATTPYACLRWYLHERKHKGPLLLVPLLRLLPIRKSERSFPIAIALDLH